MPRWSDEELKELEDPDAWDLENLEPAVRTRSPRAVVSVAFNAVDFDRLAAAVERSGKKLSTFIREAAMERASPSPKTTTFESFGGTSGSFAVSAMLGPVSAVYSQPTREERAEEPTEVTFGPVR